MASKAFEKQLKAASKAGGKRGVELEGARDMGGLDFFCTTIEEADGSLELLVAAQDAMNEEPDETAEERRGGAAPIGKMIFSAGKDTLAICCDVPEAQLEKVNCKDWLEAVCKAVDGTVVMARDMRGWAIAFADSSKNRFSIKMKDDALATAFGYLREKGAIPELDDGSDSDDFILGDDDLGDM